MGPLLKHPDQLLADNDQNILSGGPDELNLAVKLSARGIVYVRKHTLGRRYQGSKGAYVSKDGELKIHALQPPPPPPPLELPKEKKEKKERVQRSYCVNKTVIRNRLLQYLNTRDGERELYFWTVTFPKGTADDVIYQVFNIWLTQLRQLNMLREYLWVAERQKNGTIHYHIAIPHRMSVRRANDIMKATLIGFSGRGLVPLAQSLCMNYNGVHITKSKKGKVINFAAKSKGKFLARYLTKYVTKNDERFEHLAWHNSRGYSNVFTAIALTIPEFKRMGFGVWLERSKQWVREEFVFVPWKEGEPPPWLKEHLYRLNSYIQEALN